ncbi:MAG TPA: orotidine-5'-phosphate decarboxylase [Terriglobales bacterium]
MSSARDQLIVALDVSSAAQAQKIVTALGDSVTFYKVGMQLYTAEGPGIVRDLIRAGRRVFLDLKYHDIPNTVGAAVREAGKLGVSLLTVHGSGGSKMLRAATEAARESNSAMKVIAVTVLTSMDQDDLNEIMHGNLEEQVVHVAGLALKAGCHGVVSSAREVTALRSRLGKEFLVVTPGVRPAGAAHGDQARVVTPAEAIAAGSTHLVVGRPITAAPNPAREAEKIIREIEQAGREVAR